MDTQETPEPRLNIELAKYEELYRAMGVQDEDILWVRETSGVCSACTGKWMIYNKEEFMRLMNTFAAKADRERDARMEQAMKSTEHLTRCVGGMTGAVVVLTIVLVCISIFQGCSS